MNAAVLQTCLRTTLRLNKNIRRHLYENLIQNYRKFSATSTHFLHLNSITRTKVKGNNNQNDITEVDERLADSQTISKRSPRDWSQFTVQKYESFSDDKSQIIFDFDEEQKRIDEGLDLQEEEEEKELTLERGVTGVFDVEELVDLLREQNGRDIAVIKVPAEIKYVDYMVFVTSKSQRHINALSQLVRRIYKKKCNKSDRPVILEGKNTEWGALDLGNIALHIMTAELRESYDLETLWTVGAQFDEKCQEEEPINLSIYSLPESVQEFSVTQVPTGGSYMASQVNGDK